MLRFCTIIFVLAISSSISLGQKKADEAYLQVLAKQLEGEWDEAFDLNEKTLKKYPKHLSSLWFRVEYMYNFGRFNDAIPMCDQFLKYVKKKDTENLQKGYWYKGYSMEQLEDYEGALKVYNLGTRYGTHHGLSVSKGRVYRLQNDSINARKELYGVIDQDMFNTDAWQQLAYFYYYISDIDSALYAIDKAIKYDDDYATYYADKADLYYYGLWEDTIPDYDYEILYNSARAITLSGGQSEGMDNMFKFVAKRNYNSALKIIGEELDASDLFHWKDLRAHVFKSHGKHLRARNEYTRLIAEDTETNPMYYTYYRGEENKELGFYKYALEDFETVTAAHPDIAGGFAQLGDIHFLMGKFDLAIKDYSDALELEPENDWYLMKRGECKVHAEDYDGALKDYNESIELDSNYTTNRLLRGRLYKNFYHDTAKANADFRKILEIDTLEKSTDLSKAFAYMHLGMTDKCLELVDYMLEKDKGADIHYDASCIYSALGMKDETLENLEIAFNEGWRGLTHALNNDDLDQLKNDPAFIDFIERSQAIYEKELHQEKLNRLDD